MAEATKQLSKLVTEFKSTFSIFKTRRSVAFAYGFMFVFVAFTVFIAFSPSSNSSSSLSFSNIFSTSITAARSKSSYVFSYFIPNQQQQPRTSSSSSSLAPTVNSTRSNNNNTTPFPEPPRTENHSDNAGKVSISHANQTSIVNKPPSSVQNQTHSLEVSDKDKILLSNQTSIVNKAPSSMRNQTQSRKIDAILHANQTSVVTKAPSSVKNQTQSSKGPNKVQNLKANQSATAASKSTNSSSHGVASNNTASLSKKRNDDGKKQRSGNDTGVVMKQGIEGWKESLMNCDLFDGEWVHDDSYPLYKPETCSFIDEQFSCVRNGRPDRDFQNMKWKPRECKLPRCGLEF